MVSSDKKVIVSYAGSFTKPQHQYFTVAQLCFLSREDVRKFRSKAKELQQKHIDPPPLVFRNQEKVKLHSLLMLNFKSGEKESNKHKATFDIYVGLPSEEHKPFMSANMKVIDVPRFDHFDVTDTEYPEFSTYFMYGDKHHIYLSHIPTRQPDFQQVTH